MRHALLSARQPQLAVAIRAFYQASPWLTIGMLTVATTFGLLQPAFVIATGVLVQAAAQQADIVLPLALLSAIFILTRVLGPVRDELGTALWRRVDQSMGDRIMRAMSSDPGLRHVEDPHIQDVVAQVEGAVTGFSVGQAAQQLTFFWSQRTFAMISLLIIGRTYWWAAVVLAVAHALGYSAARWHWNEVTLVILGRTDQMRRSFYLRGLALSSRAAKETRVFGLARWLVDRYRQSAMSVLEDVWTRRRNGWFVGAGIALLLASTEAVTIWFVGTDSLAGRVSLGNAVAIVQALFAAGFLSQYNDPDWSITQAAVAVDKVRQLEDTVRTLTSELAGQREAHDMPRQEIRFEHVAFNYPGSSHLVFDDFSLTIQAGKSLAIVGENGAGKTTLVKLLSRLYEPTAGRIMVDGIDLRELEPAAWHSRIAAVFQDFTQFELSAYDNVAFGALHAADNTPALDRAARQAGALEIITRLPQGWNTPLSRELRHGSQISGGEWQRLALARALFAVQSGAGILILDEPTASLDVRGEAEVYRRFLELTAGVTTIVISHRFSTVRRADRIVVVEHGRVIEDGTHDDLIGRAGGRYAEMFSLQAERFAAV
jgi:ATP-binding cassette, subfamily B, bacterial